MAQLSSKVKCYLASKGKTSEEIEELLNGRTKLTLVNDRDTDKIEVWNVDGITKPTDSELAAFETEAKANEELLTVQKNRRTAYPNWDTQLDYIYHNGLAKWKTNIVDPVKAKYPKPS